MSADETRRLAALELTLMGAAERQVRHRRRRRRRALIAPALAAPLVLAAAGSMAATGLLPGVDRNLSVLRDDRLQESPRATARLESAAGERPRDAASRRTWRVGQRRVIGYLGAAGSFCFEFAGLSGGCLPRAGLSAEDPVDAIVDNGQGRLRVYGLVMDGATAVTLRMAGATRRASVGRNAFFLEVRAPGGARAFTATLIVTLRDGSLRRIPLRSGGSAATPGVHVPGLPGMMPGANAAA